MKTDSRLLKMSKIGKGKYSSKKLFLNATKNKQLSSFSPDINKVQTLIGYVKAQTGLKGLSSLAHDTAGDVINTALDVITSIL